MLRLFAFMTDQLLFADDFAGTVDTNRTGWDGYNLSGSGNAYINTGTGGYANAWAKTEATLSDGEFLVRTDRNGNSTYGGYSNWGLVDNGTADGVSQFVFGKGVWLTLDNTQTSTSALKLWYSNGTSSNWTTVSHAWATGTGRWIRLRKEGNTAYVKIWATTGTGDFGLSNEPGAWTVTQDITGYTTSSPVKFFAGIHNDNTSTAQNIRLNNFKLTEILVSIPVNHSASPATSTSVALDPTVTRTRNPVYTATPGASTSLMVSPDVSAGRNIGIAAVQATASGSMVMPKVPQGSKVLTPLDVVALTEASPAVNQLASRDGFNIASLDAKSGSGDQVLLTTPLGLPAGSEVAHASMSITFASSSGSTTVKAYSVDAPYNPETVSWSTKPAIGAIQSASVSGSSGTKTLDVVEIVKAINAGTAYGIALVVTAGTGNTYLKTGYGSTDPVALTMTYWASGDLSAPAPVANASGAMPDVTVMAGKSKTTAASVSTGSALAVQPDVSTTSNPDVDVTVSAFTASATMPGGGFSVPISTTAAVGIGSGISLDVEVTSEKNARVLASAGSANGYLEAPSEARNASDDTYFNMLRQSTDFDDAWYRLDEVSGNVIHASLGGDGSANTNLDANVFGSLTYGVTGPEGRRSIRFNNAYFECIRGQISDEMTFEVVLRTTQKNGLLAYGLDASPQTAGTFRNAVWLTDGRVTFNGEYTGVRDISDGQWHHVMVVWGHGNPNILDDGMRIYIDGKLDLRRGYTNVPQGRFAAPDWYFGMPDYARPAGIPGNFVGDVMEVVYRANVDLDQHSAQQLYYGAMGIVPVAVAPFTASGLAGNAKGKGNQKRALMLYFNTNRVITGQPDTTEAGRYSDIERGDFDFGLQIQTPGMPYGFYEKVQVGGYRLFFQSVDIQGAGTYRDYVTDLPRLLDLEKDIDVSEYDLIMYKNFPDDGDELDRLLQIGFTMQDLENHLNSLRNVVDKGVSLWVSNPTLANRLGIISRAEFIPTLRESKSVPRQGENQYNHWDEHSFATDPWGAEGEWAYKDTYRNNKERVVANIEGMTDIPAEILKRAMIWDVHDIGKWNNRMAMDFEPRPNGLLLGDEYLEPTMWWNDLTESDYYSASGYGQYVKGMYAVPPTAVLAGTPVTKLGTTTWEDGNVEKANPYAEYVGTIVVQPGDSLKGRPIGGKILVTLSQDPRWALFDGFGEYRRQLVPPNSLIPNPTDHENDEKRAWDYSFWRVLLGSSQGQGSTSVTPIVSSDGSVSYITNTKSPLAAGTIAEKFPTEPVKTLNMIQRGIRWLSERITTAPGEVVMRPAAAEATGTMPNITTRVEKSVVANAQVALSVAQMVNPDEVVDPDVSILVLPATGSGEIVNYTKKIVVEPFIGSGTMTENEEVVAQRETIALFLLRPEEIILYMEEN